MKRPNGEILVATALLVGGAIYLVVKLATIAPEFQAITIALAATCVVTATLLLVRFRWSPELVAVVLFFFLAWSLVRGVTEGFTWSRIGLAMGAVMALTGYPTLRHAVRGPTKEPQ